MTSLPPPPPPPPRGPAHGGRPRPEARPLLVSGRLAQAFISVQVVVAAFSAHALWRRADILDEFTLRRGVGDRQIDSADTRVIVTSLLHSTTYLVAGVVFLVWFHTAYRNVEARGRAKHTSGWAIGAWFVPFLGMWRPVKMTEELLDEKGGIGRKVLLWVWWGLWVFSMAVWSVAIAILPSEIDDFIALDSWSAVGRAAHAVAGGILVWLIREVMRIDEAAST